jgi:hypothetical protein
MKTLDERSGSRLLLLLVIVLLAGLPLAVWLDLRAVSSTNLARQASDLNIAITDIRDFYASDVVGHVLASSAQTHTTVTPDFQTVPLCDPDSRHVFARTRPRDRCESGEHPLQVRVGLSVPAPRRARP